MSTTQSLPKPRQRKRALDVQPEGGAPEGYLEIKRTRYGSEPETIREQVIHVPQFPVPPAYITVGAKETVNMGDYNSVGVEVRLTLPCLPEMSEIERVQDMASDVVDGWMAKEIDRQTNPDWQKPE